MTTPLPTFAKLTVVSTDEAAKYEPGPALLLAGPGTGKTECLAYRLKWLIEEKSQSPSGVTVITFTAEAARNMRERISRIDRPQVYIPPAQQPERISTMHSYGLSILRRRLAAAGFSTDPNVLTETSLRRLIFEDAAQLLGHERSIGKQAMDKRQQGTLATASVDERAVVTKYREILRATGYIDFDDQIILACEILETDSTLLEEVQAECSHLMVDEYQDINAEQDRFIKLLTGNSRAGLFVVGDDDQSIYSFRGGSPDYMRSFESDYSGTVLRIAKCRRCPRKVMLAALDVVEQHNTGRLPKPDPEFEESEDGEVVKHSTPSEDDEANLIANKILACKLGSSVLILVPSGL
jgi:DNA helicase II / ATP-dependent DNA helicase PcrA